jgi:hypothetical protein
MLTAFRSAAIMDGLVPVLRRGLAALIAAFSCFAAVGCAPRATLPAPQAMSAHAMGAGVVRRTSATGACNFNTDSGAVNCTSNCTGSWDGVPGASSTSTSCSSGDSDPSDPGSGLGGGTGDPGPPAPTNDPSLPDIPPPSDVAIYSSAPSDGQRCGNNPGSGYGYHDNLNYVRNGVPAQVQNVNEVIVAEGFPFSAGGQLMVQDTLIGWMYQDQWGYYYFQANPNLSWSPSVGVSYTAPGGFGVSFGFNAVPNTTPQMVKNANGPVTGTPHLSVGKYFEQCWTALKLM